MQQCMPSATHAVPAQCNPCSATGDIPRFLTIRLHHSEDRWKVRAFVVAGGVLQMTEGRGVDLVIEATNSPDGMVHAVECARIGGEL